MGSLPENLKEQANAADLREWLTEMFKASCLCSSASLSRCLVSTTANESARAGARLRKICRWSDDKMALRGVAPAPLITEHNFQRIMGYRDIRIPKEGLNRDGVSVQQEVA